MVQHNFLDVSSNFATIMAPTTKLTKKTESFFQTKECQKAWELIKQKYIETLILISPNWQVEFHVHTNASLLMIGATLFKNLIGRMINRWCMLLDFLIEQNKIIAIQKKRFQQWFLLCTSSYIICQAISLFSMQTIWHWFIQSTNHKFQGKQLGDYYCFQNMTSQQCISQVELMQLQMFCQYYQTLQNPQECLIKPQMQVCFTHSLNGRMM